MSTDSNRVERRVAQRFQISLPLSVCFEERTAPGFTQDLSARGVFFYTEAALPVGADVELTFTMPCEITLGDNMPVRCRGRVVRATPPQDGQHSGIAVQLDSYEYLPASEREPTPQFVRVSPASGEARPIR
jgi:hypothetical protein